MYNKKLKGSITVPGDKSISHRAVMFASIAKGVSHIKGFLNGADCISTINCFRQMGIEIEQVTYDCGKPVDCNPCACGRRRTRMGGGVAEAPRTRQSVFHFYRQINICNT